MVITEHNTYCIIIIDIFRVGYYIVTLDLIRIHFYNLYYLIIFNDYLTF